ncbi:hypothetical protein KW790_03510 [Candidatus Parcubacteria bacterium]|nr:hypothetical protein [Candidatus Parcubacteria bacterium]
MKKFSIRFAFVRAWDHFESNLRVLIVATLVFLAVTVEAAMRKDAGTSLSPSFILFSIAFFILYVIIRIGWIKLALKIEKGEKPAVEELFRHGDLFFRFILTGIAYSFLCFVGLILFIIPGFYFALKYQFATVLVVDKEGISMMDAFKESARITKRSLLKLLILLVVIVLLNAIAAKLYYIGLIITIPVTTLAYIYVYRTLQHHGE